MLGLKRYLGGSIKSNGFSVFHRACKINRNIEAYSYVVWMGKFMNSRFGSNQKMSPVYRHYDTNGAISQARESRSHQDLNSNERLNHMIENHV